IAAMESRPMAAMPSGVDTARPPIGDLARKRCLNKVRVLSASKARPFAFAEKDGARNDPRPTSHHPPGAYYAMSGSTILPCLSVSGSPSRRGAEYRVGRAAIPRGEVHRGCQHKYTEIRPLSRASRLGRTYKPEAPASVWGLPAGKHRE